MNINREIRALFFEKGYNRHKGYVMYIYIYLLYQVEFLFIISYLLPFALLLNKSVVGNHL
jgi:hypothetical protein